VLAVSFNTYYTYIITYKNKFKIYADVVNPHGHGITFLFKRQQYLILDFSTWNNIVVLHNGKHNSLEKR